MRDWLYVEDHARAIDLIFHRGRIAETYNIGGFNEWRNIDLIRVIVRTADRLLGNPEGHSEHLITYVTDRAGHDLRYAIDSAQAQGGSWAGSRRCNSRRESRRPWPGTWPTSPGSTTSLRDNTRSITTKCMPEDNIGA